MGAGAALFLSAALVGAGSSVGTLFFLFLGLLLGWKGVYMLLALARANMRRGVTRAVRGVALADRGVG